MSPSISRSGALVAASVLSLFASALVAPLSAHAQESATANTGDAAPTALTARLRDAHVRYGTAAVVTGRSEKREAGVELRLEFRPRGGQWAVIATTTTRAGGRYRLRAKVPANGRLRVVAPAAGAVASSASEGPEASGSDQLTIAVAATFAAVHLKHHVIGGRSVRVRGVVRPRGAGRVVRLQARLRGHWRTVARARTSRRGSYAVRWRPRGLGRHAVRIRVTGDQSSTSARRGLGRVNVYRRAIASWYGPGLYGNRTSCGQTLTAGTLGVANKTLPCGTRVTFRYRGRSVTVPVIDRGPFVGGREWDLTAATKYALGFGSTGVVQSTA